MAGFRPPNLPKNRPTFNPHRLSTKRRPPQPNPPMVRNQQLPTPQKRPTAAAQNHPRRQSHNPNPKPFLQPITNPTKSRDQNPYDFSRIPGKPSFNRRQRRNSAARPAPFLPRFQNPRTRRHRLTKPLNRRQNQETSIKRESDSGDNRNPPKRNHRS